MTDHIQHFTAPDGTPMVILTRALYDRLVGEPLDEDAADLAAAQEGLVSRVNEGGLPLDVERFIAAGIHPLAAWRKYRRLSQAALGEAAGGLTQAAIARLERATPGSGRPETLDALAKALDAPRWTLEHEIPEEKGPERTRALMDRANPPEQRLMRAAGAVDNPASPTMMIARTTEGEFNVVVHGVARKGKVVTAHNVEVKGGKATNYRSSETGKFLTEGRSARRRKKKAQRKETQ